MLCMSALMTQSVSHGGATTKLHQAVNAHHAAQTQQDRCQPAQGYARREVLRSNPQADDDSER